MTDQTDRSTTMTDQTISADELRALLDGEGSADDKIQAIYDDLLPPAPLPDPLFLAKATHPEHGEGAVISRVPDGEGEVLFVFRSDETDHGSWQAWVSPATLTFHTPETPDHPVFLVTEEDYSNAPEGTIVANNDERPVVLVDELWRHAGPWTLDHREMAGARRRVLRWRWEA